MERYDVLIVGAGHGGAQAAIALRQQGFAGSLALIGNEGEPPYERPPLSKEYLSGAKTFERLLIRPATFWVGRDVALLRASVVRVDPAARQVATAEGIAYGYGHLIWAAGGAPRRLSCAGHDLAGVHMLRTRADADRLRAELPSVARVVVIGGGYIGLEAAAVLVAAGKQVTLLEALDRVLARVAGEPLSRFYEAEHRAHGVDLRLGARVACIEDRDGRVVGVRLADGEILPCEAVIAGIGIEPTVRPLLEAGAEGGNGVLVDQMCLTSLPDVSAIGDCTLRANRYAAGALVRVESVQNANDQATVVARRLTGSPAVYDAVPWFWSNQYDLKLQTIGLSIGHDAIVTRGDPAARNFSLVYLREGRVIALDCVNAVRDYVHGKRLVQEGMAIAPERLADVTVPLKELS